MTLAMSVLEAGAGAAPAPRGQLERGISFPVGRTPGFAVELGGGSQGAGVGHALVMAAGPQADIFQGDAIFQ